MARSGLAIGLVSPFSWTRASAVNRHVGLVAGRLADRGHRVTIIAPSGDRRAVREARQRVREVLMDDREAVFDPEEPYPHHFFAGGTYSVPLNRSTKLIAASADLLANVDVLLRAEQLDVLHVHEPFVPGLGWTSLRHAGCPLVATFHRDSEQYRTYWLARPKLRRYFEAFDHVLAVSRAVRDSVWSVFEGDVDVVPDCVDTARYRRASAAAEQAGTAADEPEFVRLILSAGGPRPGVRQLLRALRRLDGDTGRLRVDVCGPRLTTERYAHLVPEGFDGQVRFHGPLDEDRVADLTAAADILCAPAPETEEFDVGVVRGMAAGLAAAVSDVAGHRELVEDGSDGRLVPPRQPRALARILRELADDPAQRARLGATAQASAQRYDVETVVDRLEDVYAAVSRPHPAVVRHTPTAEGTKELYADFHMHSEHSKDCVVPVRDLLERARECGLDVIAITDHDTADGGLEGRDLADEYGVRVIVGEEVKTTEGEVVGLFLERTIPGGMSFAETVAAIREQDGIVYLPHPFDRLHTVPGYPLLKQHVADIDVVEVFNSRLAFPAFNERAEQFAQRYRVPAAAGSDAHVLASLGTAVTAMGQFNDRSDFLEALSDSRIIRRPKSYLYLTGLKFLQTSFDGATRRAEAAAVGAGRHPGRGADLPRGRGGAT